MKRVLILLAFAVAGSCKDAPSTARHREPGLRTVQSGDFTLTYSTERGASAMPGVWWGPQDGSGRFSRFQLLFRGTVVPVWRSSISALAGVRVVRLAPRDGGTSIRIEGGDASESYEALLIVRENGLTDCKITSGEFPRNFSETIRYVNIPQQD